MNIEDLNAILKVATIPHRKGEVVVEHGSVTEVFGYPHITEVPSGMRLVDVHFIDVAVDMNEARAAQPRLEEILGDYPEPERLAGGPSYIELGGVLGDQEAALRLIALGAALGMWDLVTPGTLGIAGADADAMAGNGFVMLSGWPAREGSRLAERAVVEAPEPVAVFGVQPEPDPEFERLVAEEDAMQAARAAEAAVPAAEPEDERIDGDVGGPGDPLGQERVEHEAASSSTVVEGGTSEEE